METVRHTEWGIGEVVMRGNYENGVFVEQPFDGKYLVVSFDGVGKRTFAIPKSFESGVLVAVGDLSGEVDSAISERERIRAEEEKERRAYRPTELAPEPKPQKRKQPKRIALSGNTEKDFERYLEETGYDCSYSYARAVRRVRRDEGLSWAAFIREIGRLIPIYDEGGAKEKIGNEQNRTVINALKRFAEFVNIHAL